MKVAEQISLRMKELRMSVRELEQRVGVSNQTVRYWLSDRNQPRPQHRLPLETALSCRFDWTGRGTFTPVDAAHPAHVAPAAIERESPRDNGREIVDQDPQRADIEMFLRLQRLPTPIKAQIAVLIDEINEQLDARPVVRTYTKRS